MAEVFNPSYAPAPAAERSATVWANDTPLARICGTLRRKSWPARHLQQ